MAPTTNDVYRTFCKRLVKLGVKSSVFADHISHGRSWVSTWLKTTGAKHDLKTTDADKLDRYFDELAQVLAQRPRLRHAKEPPALDSKTG